MGSSVPYCAQCKQPMTSVPNGRKQTLLCLRCDHDPLISPNVQKLIQAVKPMAQKPEKPTPE